MKKILKNKKGFTLVELVVVIAILAILALILVPSIAGYVGSAEEAKDQANARSLWTAGMLVEQTSNATTPESLAAETIKMASMDGVTGVTVTFTGNKLTSVTVNDQTLTATGFSE